MMGPNDVLNGIEIGLAAVISVAAISLAAIAYRYRKQVIRAEKMRLEIKHLRAIGERKRFESHLRLESYTEEEDEPAVLTR